MSESEEVQGESLSPDDSVDSSPTAEANTEVTTEVEASVAETHEEDKKPNRVQERINQLTREKYEEKQKREELEQRLRDLESNKPEVVRPNLAAPNEDDFDSYTDYQAANADYYAKVALKAADDRLAEANKAQEEQLRQQAIQSKKEAFDNKLQGKRENFEDFEDVAYGHNFMDLDLAEQIFDLDKGPEVAYHLGSHLDEAARIFALTPVQRARELTKLEFKVEALNPKKVSSAPAPINTLGNSEVVPVDEDKMSADEWRAWRIKQLHG